MITRRMSAEAAKESAENMLKKIENDYKLGSDQNLREWIYGGIDRINGILAFCFDCIIFLSFVNCFLV